MKRKVIVLIGSLLTLSSIGQYDLNVLDCDVESSELYQVVDGFKGYFIENDEILAVKIRGIKTTFQIFDLESNELVEVYVDESLPVGCNIERIMKWHEEYYVLYSLWNKKANSFQLFYRQFNFNESRYSGEEKLMFSSKGKVINERGNSDLLYGEGGNSSDNFFFEISRDSSYFLARYKANPKSVQSKCSWAMSGLCLFDEELTPLADMTYELSNYNECPIMNDFHLSNDGVGYFLQKVFFDKKTIKNNRKDSSWSPDHKYELVQLDILKQEKEIYTIELEEYGVSTMAITNSSSNHIELFGLYQEEDKYAYVKGIITYEVNLIDGKSDSDIHPFSQEFLTQYPVYKDKDLLKKDSRFTDRNPICYYGLILMDVINNDDNSLSVICRQRFVLRKKNGTDGFRDVTFINDDVICKLDKDGELVQKERIPHEFINDNSLKYKYYYHEGQIYLLFFDGIFESDEMIESNTGLWYTPYWFGYLTIKESGEISKNILVKLEKGMFELGKGQYRLDRVIPIGIDTFYIENYTGEKLDRMLKIEMEE